MALDLGGRARRDACRVRVAARQAARRRRLARVLHRQRDRGPDARHERHLLRRDRRVAPLPHHRRHRVPPRALADGRGGDRLRARLPDARPARSRGGATTPPTARCSPARRASTSACGARSRSRSGSGTSGPTGSCRSARSPSPSRTGPTCSSTRTAGRWTGTTRSSVACCAATPRDARIAALLVTRSSSRAAASAACRTSRGSPRPRRASW